MAIDDILGRDYLFHDGYTITTVTVVGWCPQRGWRLAARGYSSTWVGRKMIRELLKKGILERI